MASPFLKVSLSSFESSKQSSVSLMVCNPCKRFITAIMATKKKKKQANKKHPVHVVAQHIISGGICKPAPSRQQIQKCLQSVLDPKNPILYRLFDGVFLERYEAAKALSSTPKDETFSLVRWLFEGAQNVLSDASFAKLVRRAISKTEPFWTRLPSPCRHCVASSTLEQCQSYLAAVAFAGSGESMLVSLNQIEQGPVVQGITFFCTKCSNVSAISYEYDTALRRALHLPNVRKTDCEHYSLLAAAYRSAQQA